MRRRALLALALTGALVTLVPPAAGSAAPHDDWNPKLPGFPSHTPEAPRANCAGGADGCIDRTIGEMWRRFHTVVPSCDHNAIFSLTYLRVTEDIREGMGIGFWPDDNWINRQDALFARIYFLAYDNFLAGRMNLVPEAWQVAFRTAANQRVQGIGNLLLAMNAHINRDFPFIIARTGVAYPDGRTRKPDHDAYNKRLRALYKPMLAELAQRFDATIDDYDVPGTVLDDELFFSLLIQWRQDAWEYAVRLTKAGSDAQRRAIAAEIEDNAMNWANLFLTAFGYLPGQTTDARNARCERHGGQRGEAYRRGADVAEPRGQARLRGRALVVKLACPDGMGPCVGRVRARGAGTAAFDIGAGDRGRARLRLTGAERSALGRKGAVRVRARSKLGPGDAVKRSATLRLRS